MKKTELYKNDDLDLKVTQFDNSVNKDCYVKIEFGKISLGINKRDDVRDIAVLIGDAITGVLWDDKNVEIGDTDWTTHEGVDAIKLHYLRRDQEKLKTLKEAYEILKEKD